VTGAPATGKSTLAPVLAQRFSCTLIEKDVIKEELFDLHGTGDANWSRRLSDASFATMFSLAGHAIEMGAGVVLEGNFRAGEHEPAIRESLAGCASSVRLVQILCTAPEALRRERLEHRARSAVRHEGHLDAAGLFPPAADAFLDLPAARFEYASECSQATEKLLAGLDPVVGSEERPS